MFDEDNFLKPAKLFSLKDMKIANSKPVGTREHVFKLIVGKEEPVILAAPDRVAFQAWTSALKGMLKLVKNRPQDFYLN